MKRKSETDRLLAADDEITTSYAGTCWNSTLRTWALARPARAVSRANICFRRRRLPAGNDHRGEASWRRAWVGVALPRNIGKQKNHVVLRARVCRAGPARVHSGFTGTRANARTVFSRPRRAVRRSASPRIARAWSGQPRSHDTRWALDGRGHLPATCSTRARGGPDCPLSSAAARGARPHRAR